MFYCTYHWHFTQKASLARIFQFEPQGQLGFPNQFSARPQFLPERKITPGIQGTGHPGHPDIDPLTWDPQLASVNQRF